MVLVTDVMYIVKVLYLLCVCVCVYIYIYIMLIFMDEIKIAREIYIGTHA